MFTYLNQHHKPNFHAKNITWLKFTINYSLYKLNYNWRQYSAISVPKECACVITNSSAKKCDWLSHTRPAPFPFPLFLFPGKKKKKQ